MALSSCLQFREGQENEKSEQGVEAIGLGEMKDNVFQAEHIEKQKVHHLGTNITEWISCWIERTFLY